MVFCIWDGLHSFFHFLKVLWHCPVTAVALVIGGVDLITDVVPVFGGVGFIVTVALDIWSLSSSPQTISSLALLLS